MALSLKEINRQRELMNYDYSHLYNIVKYGGSKFNLQPRTRKISEVKAGADPAEYGVIFTNRKGQKAVRKFSTLEMCVEEADRFNGMVVRLGGLTPKAFDAYGFTQEEKDRAGYSVDWETGLVEFVEKPVKGDSDYNSIISLALEEMGYQKAIQYTSTRPAAKDLLMIHKRHPDMSIEDFAAAVLKHCEIPPQKEVSRSQKPGPFKSWQEKEDWYSTSAGQAWVKDNPIPPIMTHTKEEYFEWKNQEQSEK